MTNKCRSFATSPQRRALPLLLLFAILAGPSMVAAQDDPPLPSDASIPMLPPQEPAIPPTTLEGQGELALLSGQTTLLDALIRLTPGKIEDRPELKTQYEQVARLSMAGDFRQAYEKLEEIVDTHERMPPASLMMAAISFAMNNPNDGFQLLEHTARQHPNFPSTYMAFARVAVSQNRVTDAMALLEKAQRVIGEGEWSEDEARMFRIEWHDSMSDVAIRRNEFEKARQLLVELKGLLPENPRVLLRLAQVEFDLGNVEASHSYLVETREHAENLRSPDVIIADWFFQKGDREQSESWIKRAAENNPDDGEVQLDYARWLMRMERLPQAGQAAQQAETLGANAFQLALVRGQIAFATGSYAVAEGHFERLHQAHPSDGNVINLLVLSLIENPDGRRRQRAQELAVMNVRMFPQDVTTIATYGWVQYRSGNVAEADRAFQQVANQPIQGPITAFFLGAYLIDQGQPEAARAFLRAALDHQDFFLYRDRAEEMLARLPAETENGDDDVESGN